MKLSCLLCGSTAFTTIRRKLRYDVKRDVLRCKRCNYVFLRPLTQAQKDFYAKSYRKKYGPNLKKSSSPREIFNTYFPFQEEIIQNIAHLLKPKLRVLEIGCSTGHFLTALGKRVGKRVGVELNKADVAFIRRNLDFKVYDKPLEELEIPEGPFDLIVSFQCLEHIEDPVRFLKNVHRHLAKNGQLYLELPNLHDALLDVYRCSGYENFYYREPHVSYFTRDTLRRLLTKTGWSGRYGNVQRYNVLNHIHWAMTNTPQPHFALGNLPPKLVNDPHVPKNIANDFNRFIQRMDADYKRMIERHDLGESLTFLGKPSRK